MHLAFFFKKICNAGLGGARWQSAASTRGIYLNIGDEARKDSNRLDVEGDNGEGISHTYMYILYVMLGGPKGCHPEMKRP